MLYHVVMIVLGQIIIGDKLLFLQAANAQYVLPHPVSDVSTDILLSCNSLSSISSDIICINPLGMGSWIGDHKLEGGLVLVSAAAVMALLKLCWFF